MRDPKERIGGICRTLKKGDLLEFLIGDEVIGYLECKGARGACPTCSNGQASARARVKIHFDRAIRIRPTETTAQERGEKEHGCNGAVLRSKTNASSGCSSSQRASVGQSPVSQPDSRSESCNEVHEPRSPVEGSGMADGGIVRDITKREDKRPKDKQACGGCARSAIAAVQAVRRVQGRASRAYCKRGGSVDGCELEAGIRPQETRIDRSDGKDETEP